MRLGLCSRSGDVLEPMITPQWYVNCNEMAKRATDAVRNKELKIVPAEQEKIWFNWLDNIRDWCVSRQVRVEQSAFHEISSPFLHSVVVGASNSCMVLSQEGRSDREERYDPQRSMDRCSLGSGTLIDKNPYHINLVSHLHSLVQQEAHEKAAELLGCPKEDVTLERDEDVLDTWFSSGLFPFSVMGWPDDTADLKAFYPTSLLETGLDILFFWVARMVMMGLELTDTLPFHTVFLHAMVRDKEGRKMSKSLGNVIDPLEVGPKHSPDLVSHFDF